MPATTSICSFLEDVILKINIRGQVIANLVGPCILWEYLASVETQWPLKNREEKKIKYNNENCNELPMETS